MEGFILFFVNCNLQILASNLSIELKASYLEFVSCSLKLTA
jgi:hypothetical protein